MDERLSKKLAGSTYVLRCASYWQAVLRFGLPFIILYRGIDYAVFRIATGGGPLPYPWRFDLTTDLVVMLFVSGLWWFYVREIAAWRRKSEAE